MNRLLLISIILLTAIFGAKADKTLDPSSLTANPATWTQASISGKVRCELFPINPTLKVYMTHGKHITMSISAPVLGEVGRLEITPDSVTAYNKMKKVYCTESLGGLWVSQGEASALLCNLQDLLLSRPFAWGVADVRDYTGVFEYDADTNMYWGTTNSEAYDVEGAVALAENGVPGNAGLARFRTDAKGQRMPMLYILLTPVHSGAKTTLQGTLDIGLKQPVYFEYEYGAPDYAAAGIKPIKTGSNWQRTDLKGFISSLSF